MLNVWIIFTVIIILAVLIKFFIYVVELMLL